MTSHSRGQYIPIGLRFQFIVEQTDTEPTNANIESIANTYFNPRAECVSIYVNNRVVTLEYENGWKVKT